MSVQARWIATICITGQLLAAFSVSCHIDNTRQAHQLVGANGETLRAAFNADVGKVRILMLVSPT